MASKVSKSSATVSSSRHSSSPPEYLVLRIGDKLVPGDTLTYLGSASSPEVAMELIMQMTDSSATRIAIVERSAVVVRRPAMAVDIVDEPVGTSPK